MLQYVIGAVAVTWGKDSSIILYDNQEISKTDVQWEQYVYYVNQEC